MLEEIDSLVAKICTIRAPSHFTARPAALASKRSASKGGSTSGDGRLADSSIRPFCQSNDVTSTSSSTTESVPASVLEGVNSFFASPTVSNPTVSDSSRMGRSSTSASAPKRGSDSGIIQTQSDTFEEGHGRNTTAKDRSRSKTSTATSSDNSAVLEAQENELYMEIVYFLRPMLYLIHQNSALLIRNTPYIFHMAITLLSLGKATIMPHIHTLVCSLLHALISCAHNVSESSAIESDTPVTVAGALFEDNNATGVEDGMESPTMSDALDQSSRRYSTSSPEEVDFSALCTKENVSLWKKVLEEFNSDAFLLIFQKAPILTPNNFERVATALSVVVRDTSSSLCKSWRNTMWNLALSAARKTPQNTRYSAFFLMVGSLIQHDSDLVSTSQCICDVFEALLHVIEVCIPHQFHSSHEPLLRPILFCLSKSIPLMETQKVEELFWLAVLLFLFFPLSYLSGPVVLMHHVVVELLRRSERRENGESGGSGDNDPLGANAYMGTNIEDALLVARYNNKQLNKIFRRIEKGRKSVIGISFESSFSTALASLLLRGLQMTETKSRELTEQTLQLLMEHYQKQTEKASQSPRGSSSTSENGISGYAAVLLTIWGDIALVSQPQTSPHLDTAQIDRRYSTSPTPTTMSTTQNRRIMIYGSKARSVISTLPEDPVYRPSLQRQRSSSTPVLPSKPSGPLAPVSFFAEHNFPTNKSVVLFTTTQLAAIKALQKMEAEQLFAHTLLLQTIRELPSVLSVLYEILFSEMSSAYAASLQKEGPLNQTILGILNECLMSGFSRQQGKVRDVSSHHTRSPVISAQDAMSELDDTDISDDIAPRHAIVGDLEFDETPPPPDASPNTVGRTTFRGLSREKSASPASPPAGYSEDQVTDPTPSEPSTTVAGQSPLEDIDKPFARGSVQCMGIDSSDDEKDESRSSRGVATSSSSYLAELGFIGLLDGAHSYALEQCGSHDECHCGSKTNGCVVAICDSCTRRKEAKHLVCVFDN